MVPSQSKAPSLIQTITKVYFVKACIYANIRRLKWNMHASKRSVIVAGLSDREEMKSVLKTLVAGV